MCANTSAKTIIRDLKFRVTIAKHRRSPSGERHKVENAQKADTSKKEGMGPMKPSPRTKLGVAAFPLPIKVNNHAWKKKKKRTRWKKSHPLKNE